MIERKKKARERERERERVIEIKKVCKKERE